MWWSRWSPRTQGHCLVLVVHACNPSYSGGRELEDQVLFFSLSSAVDQALCPEYVGNGQILSYSPSSVVRNCISTPPLHRPDWILRILQWLKSPKTWLQICKSQRRNTIWNKGNVTPPKVKNSQKVILMIVKWMKSQRI
jgi:hypothetical protein